MPGTMCAKNAYHASSERVFFGHRPFFALKHHRPGRGVQAVERMAVLAAEILQVLKAPGFFKCLQRIVQRGRLQ